MQTHDNLTQNFAPVDDVDNNESLHKLFSQSQESERHPKVFQKW
jgi:hypothetical protein